MKLKILIKGVVCGYINNNPAGLLKSKLVFIMNLTAVILTFSCLTVSAAGFAQKITLSEKNAPLKTVLQEIRKQSGYQLVYNSDLIDKARFVNINVQKVSLKDALTLSLAGQPFTFQISENIILIKPKNESVQLNLDAGAQRIEIRGKVSDTKGEALIGVSIIVKGTSTGTSTDINGNFSINAPADAVLVLKYIGYVTQEIAVDGQSTLDIRLREDMQSLSEVVVTALGIQRNKKSLSYAAQNITTSELTQARSTNLLEGLGGKVAGLSITNSGSGVGAASKVLLRGNRSISGSSQPLYIVDGITLNGDISNLSPDDIESLSVLKGANAAALYGSRANNGAIVVVTKSGKGAAKGVTSNIGFTYNGNDPIILTKYQNQYGQGAGGVYSPSSVTSWGPKFDGSQVAHWSNDPNYIANQLGGSTTYAYTAQPDNIKDFFQSGRSFATNLSVNINSEKSNVALGYTHTDASGIIKGNNLGSHNLSMRMLSDLSKRLKLDSKVNYIRQDFKNVLFTGESFNNPMRYLYQIPRNIRTRDIEHYEFANAAGQIKQHFYSPNFNGAGNPYWTRNNIENPLELERVLGMLSLSYKISDNWSIQGRSALDRSNSMGETKLHNDTYVIAANGSYSRLNSNSFEWNTDALLTFSKDLSKSFKINLNAGANNRVYKANALGGSGVNFQIQNLFSLANTLDPRPADTYERHKEVQSVYGFGDISFKDAIFLNITGRNDWSSTLPSNNRSYFYPSVGLSAILTDLVTLPKFFTYAKFRASYAEVGNDTDPYNLSRTASISNGTISLSPVLPNANLRPESTHSTELGLELRMLEGKLRFDATAYRTNTFDQLFASPVPVGSGVSSVFQNGADIQNKGFEASLGTSLFSEREFNWDIDLNFSKNKSTVLEIAEGFDQLSQASDYIRIYKLVKGQPFGDIYSRGYVRDAQGRVIVSANGLPQITTGQDVKVANFNPDWLAGLNNSFRYKNFSLSTLIDVRKGGAFISFTEAIESGVGVLDYTEQGRDGSLVFGGNIFTNETAVTQSGAANTINVSSERLWNHLGGVGAPVGESFVRDATNIRLRELVFGYQLPAELLSKTPFRSARLSLVGRNLFFLYNKSEYVDPEMVTDVANSSEGRESLSLPTTRSFGLSLNFGF